MAHSVDSLQRNQDCLQLSHSIFDGTSVTVNGFDNFMNSEQLLLGQVGSKKSSGQ